MNEVLSSLIVPYCIYQNIDTKGLIMNGVISMANIMNNQGKYSLNCQTNSLKYDQWSYIDTFYAINPLYLPIFGIELICIRQSNQFPYDSSKIEIVYDITNEHDDCVYFMCWTDETPNTTPLYLYESGNHILPSLKKINSDVWKESPLSPIYVLDGPNTKFKLIDGRCVPDINGVPLHECVVQYLHADFQSGCPPGQLSCQFKKEKRRDWKSISTVKIGIGILLASALIAIICSIIVLRSLFQRKR